MDANLKCDSPLHEVEIIVIADPEKPGIYVWKIEDAQIYVGKYRNKSRPLKEYARNLRNIIQNKPYHIKGRDFRRIHYALNAAVLERKKTYLVFFENVADDPERNKRERELITELKANLND